MRLHTLSKDFDGRRHGQRPRRRPLFLLCDENIKKFVAVCTVRGRDYQNLTYDG